MSPERYIVELPISAAIADVAGAPVATIERIVRTVGSPSGSSAFVLASTPMHDLDGRGLEAARDENGLLPCPFCGGAGVFDASNVVCCEECSCRLFLGDMDFSQGELAEAWNRRASSPNIGEVEVRGLDWVKHPVASMWRADTPLGLYTVADMVYPPTWTYDGYQPGIKARGESLMADGAMAACQADYAQRIRSALVPSPQQHSSQVVSQEGGWVSVPKAALDWLMGSGPDPAGHWFGDFPEDQPRPQGAFWWRRTFNDIVDFYRRSTPLTETAKAEHVGAEVVGIRFAEQYCLGLIAEEAGEVLQHLGKAFRFGIDTPGKLNAAGKVSGETPRTLLPSELGDLLAAIEFTMRHGIVLREEVEAARLKKLAKLTNPEALDNLGRPLAPQPDAAAPQPSSVGGERDEVIEECAKVADAVAKEIKAKGWPQYAAQQCAAAIRALSTARADNA